MAIARTGGRAAITDFVRIARFDSVDLLRAHLHTGRTHQIRVHLASIGHAVVGDETYGGAASARKLATLPPRRQFLHAAWLTFSPSRHGDCPDFRSELPAGPPRDPGAGREGSRRSQITPSRSAISGSSRATVERYRDARPFFDAVQRACNAAANGVAHRVHSDQRHRFENFIVGPANRVAVAAACAVAETPGAVYNPLFVHGEPGLGKTHVLLGLAQLALRLQPRCRSNTSRSPDFDEQYLAARAAARTIPSEAWIGPLAAAQLLLIDDIQSLAGRRETQAEFLRCTLTRCARSARQLVVTSDRPPRALAATSIRASSRALGEWAGRRYRPARS